MTLPAPTRWPVGTTGYVAIVGRPNVGKSTFLNHVLGGHFLAVSPLPQTTRQHWRGILSDATSQLIFVDTPGAHVGKTKLNELMLDSVLRSLQDADVVICLIDPTRPNGEEDELVASRVAESGKECLLVVNKCDLAEPDQIAGAVEFYLQRLGPETPLFQIAALTGDGVEELVTHTRQMLPQGPFFYPPDQAMDAVERDLGAELIREAALGLLREEIPHALAVEILEWKDKGKRLKITANLYVERDSQKGIVVGKNGAMVADIRRQAIKALRDWLDQHIVLSLYVKVARDWRNRSRFLEEHGWGRS